MADDMNSVVTEALWAAFESRCTGHVDREYDIIDAGCGSFYMEDIAAAVIDMLELSEEPVELAPIWMPVFDDSGKPVMDDQMVPPHPLHEMYWRPVVRYVTPYRDTGPRITSAELSARLEGKSPTDTA